MCDSVEILKGSNLGVRLDNSRINLIINFVRSSIKQATARIGLADNHEGPRFGESAVGIFVHKHGLDRVNGFKVIEESFARGVEPNVGTGMQNRWCSSDLNDHDTIVRQGSQDSFEVFGVVQILRNSGGCFWFHGVHNDYVKLFFFCLAFREPFLGIFQNQIQMLVVETILGSSHQIGAIRHERHVGLGNINQLVIDLHHGNRVNRLVLQYLFQGSTLCTSNDRHAFGIGVRKHTSVDQCLMVFFL
mmetsp:Transcript_11625/g.33463  ORF Transcript_11625/g.33463 Transcript_11625/m.33463 type:complete len:246 (+) Transcript_11625:637-1374(+)